MPSYAPCARLRAGDRVAVVALSSPAHPARVAAGLEVLRGWGLEPVLMPSAHGSGLTGLPHLAASDVQRADDLVAAWRDKDVKAIWCARGGYGVQRILDLLPRRLFAKGTPKPIIGFSDVTPLLHRAARESGAQMVHGPMVMTLGEAEMFALDQLHDLLWLRPEPRTLLTGLTSWALAGSISQPPSDVEGPLLGGNVALLGASIGTRDLPKASGAVVLLEDVGQSAWVLDRGLTQLLRSGWLNDATGILLGEFWMDDEPDLVEAVLRDRLLPLGIPIWTGAAVGHGEVNFALPIGGRVRVGGGYLRLA